MASEEHLLIFGASARAAAFSALRAGLRPWCVDLFGDADLEACCTVQVLRPGSYPQGFLQASLEGPRGPWLYTGGLENHPALVRRIAELRRLWGNDEPALKLIRSPHLVRNMLGAAGLPFPKLCTSDAPTRGNDRWLVKPLRGAGGTGVRDWTGRDLGPVRDRVYFQEFIEGTPCAALYVGDGRSAALMGITRQLVGEKWLHGRPFAYCGSIGPLPLTPALQLALERLGHALTQGARLRGLFGVDFILRDDVPWPVEVNPRYTASVEVLELAQRVAALSWHRGAFQGIGSVPMRKAPPEDRIAVVGKAVLFARAPIVFPGDGPWHADLRRWRDARSGPIWAKPGFADIPHAGQTIRTNRPILTFFAEAENVPACMSRLREIARGLDQRLGND